MMHMKAPSVPQPEKETRPAEKSPRKKETAPDPRKERLKEFEEYLMDIGIRL